MISSAASVACSCSTTTSSDDREDDQEPAQRRVHAGEEALSCAGHVRPHGERSCHQGSPGEPGEPRAPVGGRVEPRREHGGERQRAVEIVQPVRRAAVVGEQQQPEPDLGDEQRLGEREQMRDEAARLPAAVVREPGEDRRAPRSPRGRGMRRCDGPLASAANATEHREEQMIEEGKPAPDFELPSDSGETIKLSDAPREARRPLLLSQGRHAGLHDAGLRHPRRVRRVRARRRRRARHLARRREART